MVFHKNHYCDDLIEASGSLKKDLIWLPHRGKNKTQKDHRGIAGCAAHSGAHRCSFATEPSAVGVEGEPSFYGVAFELTSCVLGCAAQEM